MFADNRPGKGDANIRRILKLTYKGAAPGRSLMSTIALFSLCDFITARRSYASAVLGVVILSARLSVCLSHACFVTNPKNLPAIFIRHMKGQSFGFSAAKDLGEIPTGSPQRGRQIEVG